MSEKRKGTPKESKRNKKKKLNNTTNLVIIPNLPSDLFHLANALCEDPERPWTDNEVKKIAGPLLKKSYKQWTSFEADPRLDLFQHRFVQQEPAQTTKDFLFAVASFKTESQCPGDMVFDRIVKADELIPIVNELETQRKWKEETVNRLAKLLRGVMYVDCFSSTPEASGAWLDFLPEWEEYLSNHPLVRAKIDPVYVVALDVVGPPAGGWPVWPPGTALPPLGPPVHGNYIWMFGTVAAAHCWCGVLRGTNPNQRTLMFNCAAAQFL